jgi:hypothetical protein
VNRIGGAWILKVESNRRDMRFEIRQTNQDSIDSVKKVRFGHFRAQVSKDMIRGYQKLSQAYLSIPGNIFRYYPGAGVKPRRLRPGRVVPRAYRPSQCLTIGKWPMAESGLHEAKIGVPGDRRIPLCSWAQISRHSISACLPACLPACSVSRPADARKQPQHLCWAVPLLLCS